MTFKKGERPLGIEEEIPKDLSAGTGGGRMTGIGPSYRAGSMTICTRIKGSRQ